MSELEQKEQRQLAWGNTFTRTSIKGLANISCMIGIRLLLATGARRGEVLAITWDRVDFESGALTIDRALNSDAVIKEPKTDAGVRTIAIDSETIDMLIRWKAFQARMLHLVMISDSKGNKHPVEQNENTPVVCSCVGSWLNPHNMNRWWNDYRKAIGFDDLRIHELRHSAATLLLGNGVPVIDVAARLGHSDVSVTLNTYGHAIPAHDKMAADLIGSLMMAANPSECVVNFERKTV